MNKIFFTMLLILLTSTAYATNTVVVIPLGRTINIDAPITWKGQWLEGTQYAEGDGLQYLGSSYISLENHTATIANAPPNDDNWSLMALRGDQGDQGNTGGTGPQGIQGEQGILGDQGATGVVGPQGLQGETGTQGIVGPQGIQGEQGLQGEQGIQGEVGASVPSGYLILGTTPTAPEGYTYTGEVMSNDKWTTRTPMPTARHRAASAVVDGKIYVMGGYDVDANALDVNEVYDPVTDTWATKASMPTVRYGMSASAVDGKIYVIGGQLASTASTDYIEPIYIYDPASDIWTLGANLTYFRSNLGTAVVDGHIYAIGGCWGSDSCNNYRRRVDMYDPATDTWTVKRDLPNSDIIRFAVSYNGRIYVGPNSSAISVYNPATDSWGATSSGEGWSNGVVLDGQIHTFPGHKVYDIESAIWLPNCAELISWGGRDGVFEVVEGKIFAIGGYENLKAISLNQQYGQRYKLFVKD